MFPARKNTIYLWQLILLLIIIFLIFLLLIYSFPRRSNIFNLFYPKPKSFAGEVSVIPSVDLRVTYQGVLYDGVVNVKKDETPLNLSWTVTGNVTSCIGRVGDSQTEDFSWRGPKDIKEGSFTTAKLDKNNPYVYTIDCQNAWGDGLGDSVAVNVGAQNTGLIPHLTNFETVLDEIKFDGQTPIETIKGDMVQINWSSLNTSTPYSVCLSTGSWPSLYKNLGNQTITEKFNLLESKFYSYRVFCSNESTYVEKGVLIFVK